MAQLELDPMTDALPTAKSIVAHVDAPGYQETSYSPMLVLLARALVRAVELRDQATAVAVERTRERDQAHRERDAGARALVAALADPAPRVIEAPPGWGVLEHYASDGKIRSVEFEHEAFSPRRWETIEVRFDLNTIEFGSRKPDGDAVVESRFLDTMVAAMEHAGAVLVRSKSKPSGLRPDPTSGQC